jgi:hypothetical protein
VGKFLFFPRLFLEIENWTFLKMSKNEKPKYFLEKPVFFPLSPFENIYFYYFDI